MAVNFLDFEQPIAELEAKIEELKHVPSNSAVNIQEEISRLQQKSEQLTQSIFASLSPWQITQLARHPQRPYTLDYAGLIFKDFHELHGDRMYGDDLAIVGGPARLDDRPVMLIGHQKGRDTKERVRRNYGMPKPEGYRKALRLMRLAERFRMPLITFIDTPGAYPGVGSEERGQSEAIARNLFEMSVMGIPIISCVIGEGGSGGALAIGVCDRLLMLQFSTYSVISPEGCASILWKSADKKEVAADAMNLTADRLFKLKLVDEVLPEPVGGAHRNPQAVADTIKVGLIKYLDDLEKLSPEKLRAARNTRIDGFGVYSEVCQLMGTLTSPFPSKRGRTSIGRSGFRTDPAHRSRGPAFSSRSAAASTPPSSRTRSSRNDASSRACASCTSIMACRPRAASGAGTVRGRRARGACRSTVCARDSSASAANRPRPPRATRAMRCSHRRCSPGEVLVTAQHEDDQAETLLLQLFRGAGVAGLAAMPAHAPSAPGTIARPLLGMSRASLEKYAQRPSPALGRRSVERRNAVRAQLSARESDAADPRAVAGRVTSIARSAQHMAEAGQLLGELAQRDLAQGDRRRRLERCRLACACRERGADNALRAWIAGFGIEAPSTAQAIEIGGRLLMARRRFASRVRAGTDRSSGAARAV